jgi:hypothetical protein
VIAFSNLQDEPKAISNQSSVRGSHKNKKSEKATSLHDSILRSKVIMGGLGQETVEKGEAEPL